MTTEEDDDSADEDYSTIVLDDRMTGPPMTAVTDE